MAVKHDGMKGRMVEAATIDRKKLFEQVAAHIERQILDGRAISSRRNGICRRALESAARRFARP